MGVQGYTADDALFVKFYNRAVVDKKLSDEAGYKVFKDEEWIEIRWDNDRSTLDIPARPADEGTGYAGDRVRFAGQYEQFKRGVKDQVVGVPLAELFPDSPARVENYRRSSIFTVEQLAAVSDTTAQSCGMGAFEDRREAQAFLEKAKRDYGTEKQRKEMESLQAQLEVEKEKRQEMELKFQEFLNKQAAAGELEFKEKKK